MGYAWYRGRLLQATQARASTHRTVVPRPRRDQGHIRAPSPTFIKDRDRQQEIQIVTWNCGGLHSEVLLWQDPIARTGPCMITLQKTHWTAASEFHKSGCACISSSSGTAYANSLILSVAWQQFTGQTTNCAAVATAVCCKSKGSHRLGWLRLHPLGYTGMGSVP